MIEYCLILSIKKNAFAGLRHPFRNHDAFQMVINRHQQVNGVLIGTGAFDPDIPPQNEEFLTIPGECDHPYRTDAIY